MLNIASFITPLAMRPDPNGAVQNAIHGMAVRNQDAQAKAQQAETGRHNMAEEGVQQGHLALAKQEHADAMDEHRQDLHTKLIDWGMGVLDKEGADKARAIVGPVWGAAGIDVDFGQGATAPTGNVVPPAAAAAPSSDEDGFAKLQAAQQAREAKEGVPEAPAEGQSYGPKPGESFTQYVARNTAKKPEPAPTTSELDEEAKEGPEAAGEEEAEHAVEGQAQPWVIKDRKTGRVYGTIDPSKVEAINQKRAYDRATAYVKGEGQTTPEGITGEFLRGSRTEPEVETRMGHAERRMGELEKTLRTQLNHKGGGGIGGGVDTKLVDKVDDNARMYMTSSMNAAGVPKLNQMSNDLGKVDRLFDSNIPAAQRQAFASQLKANFGAAASEGERRFMEENAGLWNRMMFHLDSVIAGGEVPPELRTEMQQVAQLAKKFAEKLADEKAEAASETLMQDPSIGGFYQRAFGNNWTPEAREAKKKSLKNLGHISEGKDPNQEAKDMGF